LKTKAKEVFDPIRNEIRKDISENHAMRGTGRKITSLQLIEVHEAYCEQPIANALACH
jgi:hypothetical protein